MKTFGEIYEKALTMLDLDVAKVEDYRPADELYITNIKKCIPMGIIIWLKTGEKIIFIDSVDGE